jgi:hypothetical protein
MREGDGMTLEGLSPALSEEAERTYRHACRYPNGCNIPGHRCEECTMRVGDTPHRFIKVGASHGRRGSWVCAVPGCPEYRLA